ncbi:hypothetical protein MASR1M32_36910 [Rhodobacter sp.]
MEDVVMFTTEGLILSASSAKLSGAPKASTGAAGIASASPVASARADTNEAARAGRREGRVADTGRNSSIDRIGAGAEGLEQGAAPRD